MGAMSLGALSFAQEIHYGLVGGLNATSSRNDWSNRMYTQKSKIGGYFGGYASKNVSNGHEVFGELLFTTIGTKFIDNEGSKYEDFSINVSGSMLQIPVYYQYNLNEKFSLNGGAYLGLILSLKGVGYRGYESDISSNTIDFGLLAGAKYRITPQFSGVFRYNFGLLDVDTDKNKNHNSIFQLGVQYDLK